MKSKLDIILPVYNEQENIEQVLRGIKKNVKTPCKIIIVPYDAKDPTIPVISRLRKEMKNVEIVKSIYGKGLANQLKSGFAHSKSKMIAIMMADLSDDPKDLDKMVEKIDKSYDFICASRYMKGGRRSKAPLLKGLLSHLACETLYYILKIPTRDATNAFKCFKRELLDEIKVESVKGFELPLELTVKAHRLGFKIGEIPTSWKERMGGKTKFKLFDSLRYYLRWYIYALKK